MKLSLGLLLGAVGTAAGIVLLACATDSADGPPEGQEGSTLPSIDATPADGAAPCDACSLDAGTTRFRSVTLSVDPRFNLFGVWGAAPNDVWAVGAAGLIVHFDGSTWKSTPSGADQALYTVWGSSANDVWAASNSGLLVHRVPDGVGAPAWTREPSVDPANWRVYSLWGPNADVLYAVGPGNDPALSVSLMARRRKLADGGGAWDEITACAYCTFGASIWGAGAGDVWMVGDRGQAQHATGPSDAGGLAWRVVQTYTQRNLAAVWGSAANDVWAVGAGGVIRHWTNDASSVEQKWTVVDSPTVEDLYALWGSSGSDVWATGNHGAVLHFDGTAWSKVETGLASPLAAAPLFGVWGSAADDVWMVGTGVVLHVGKGPGQ